MLLLPRPTQIVTISSTENNTDLYSKANSPAFPLNLLCFINANIGSTSNTTPAFRTGTGWKGGSLLYVDNNATITGGSGPAGSPGTSGPNGAGGAGGSGASPAVSPNRSGSGGTPGGTGGTGGTGPAGSQGPAVSGNSNITAYINTGTRNGPIS